jgi:PEP-CTERM motif
LNGNRKSGWCVACYRVPDDKTVSSSDITTMKRPIRLLLGALLAIAVLPTTAFAFVVTADPTTVDSGQTIRFTLSGTASNLEIFAVGVTPGFPFDEASATLTFVGATTGALAPDVFSLTNSDPSLGAPLQFIMQAQLDFSACPPACDLTPFSIVDGDILVVELQVLGSATPGPSNAQFSICTSFDCIPGQGTALPPVDITIGPGTNNVPEPATLWLAAAALVAGVAVSRRRLPGRPR